MSSDEWPENIASGALKPGTVPLMHNGERVGSATVNSDGVVTQIEWDGKIPVDVETVAQTDDHIYLLPRKTYNVFEDNATAFVDEDEKIQQVGVSEEHLPLFPNLQRKVEELKAKGIRPIYSPPLSNQHLSFGKPNR